MYQRGRPQSLDEKKQSGYNENIYTHSTTQTRTLREGIAMANKKKTIEVGTIKGLDIIRQTKPIQDIPFRTGVYTDKRKKREKVNKRNMDRWM